MDTVEDQDYKVFNRELNRLKLSFRFFKGKCGKIIVVLHYPPFNIDCSPNGFIDIVKRI